MRIYFEKLEEIDSFLFGGVERFIHTDILVWIVRFEAIVCGTC